MLTELTVVKTIQVAKEIQDLTKEVRSNPITLKLWHMPEVQHWQDPWQIRSTTTDLKEDLLWTDDLRRWSPTLGKEMLVVNLAA